MLDTTLFALMHILVFVYWLGGDLGAFYSSRFLTMPDVSADRRLMAAKIVGDVDMAPRTALIMALPTGLLLAISKGWIATPMVWGWVTFGLGVGWLALAWYLHHTHGASAGLKQLDLAIRWLFAILLVFVGVSALIGHANDVPLFIAAKCLLLAGAVLTGLFIRRVLTPLGPALMSLSGPDAASAEMELAATLSRARPLVMLIWLLIISAAFFGLLTPV
ncbi:MAG: hypothetical protein AAF292_07835 [Pseudomonadota bacterium]